MLASKYTKDCSLWIWFVVRECWWGLSFFFPPEKVTVDPSCLCPCRVLVWYRAGSADRKTRRLGVRSPLLQLSAQIWSVCSALTCPEVRRHNTWECFIYWSLVSSLWTRITSVQFSFPSVFFGTNLSPPIKCFHGCFVRIGGPKDGSQNDKSMVKKVHQVTSKFLSLSYQKKPIDWLFNVILFLMSPPVWKTYWSCFLTLKQNSLQSQDLLVF